MQNEQQIHLMLIHNVRESNLKVSKERQNQTHSKFALQIFRMNTYSHLITLVESENL